MTTTAVIQLPPNGSGTIVSTRDDHLSRARQLVGVAEPLRPAPDRSTTGRIVWYDDFTDVLPSIWNDGAGFIALDDDIRCLGLPSLRLDTDGVSAGVQADPGRTAKTSGVVAKTRIHDNCMGRWGFAMWFRLTGLNNTTNAKLSMSIYNRTGIDNTEDDTGIARHFRVWLDPDGNNQSMVARILDGAATGPSTDPSDPAVYTAVVTSDHQNGGGSHTYDLPTGRLDRVGGWHYVKMVVDFSTGHYVSLQLDSHIEDISQYEWDVTESTGFAGMHMSVEYHGNSSTRRFVNIAALRGTLED